jgi:hypothetical protein
MYSNSSASFSTALSLTKMISSIDGERRKENQQHDLKAQSKDKNAEKKRESWHDTMSNII